MVLAYSNAQVTVSSLKNISYSVISWVDIFLFPRPLAVSGMPGKPSLDAKMCPAKCFKINIGLCHYKGTEPIKVSWFLRFLWAGPPSGCLQRSLVNVCIVFSGQAQMSVLILSRELSIFVRVFLMRNAVNLADGFWYQHSFMSLAMEVNVWKWIWRNKSISMSPC